MNIDISVREFFGTGGASAFVRFGIILGFTPTQKHTCTRGSVHYFAATGDAQPSCHHFDERERERGGGMGEREFNVPYDGTIARR